MGSDEPLVDESIQPLEMKSCPPILPVTLLVKILVCLDFTAVALVLPLMSSYSRDLKMSGTQNAWISSSFQLAQLFGGVTIGALTDSGLGKRGVLLLSFSGSAIAYLLIPYAVLQSSPSLLFASRVIVGLVKQTLSTSTVILTEASESTEERTRHLGHITGCMSLCFVVGPTLGAMLYKQSRALPCVAAAFLFLVNIVLVLVFLPEAVASPTRAQAQAQTQTQTHSSLSVLTRVRNHIVIIVSRIAALAAEPSTFAVIVLRQAYAFFESAMSPRLLLNYYELKFGIQTHELGYLSSLASSTGIIIDLFLLQPLLNLCSPTTSKETSRDDPLRSPKPTPPTITNSLFLAALFTALAATAAVEASSSVKSGFLLFLASAYLPSLLVGALLSARLKSLMLDSIEKADVGKTLGVLNLVSSVSGVLAPLYGSHVMTLLSTAAAQGSDTSLAELSWLATLTLPSTLRGSLVALHHMALAALALWLARPLDAIQGAVAHSTAGEELTLGNNSDQDRDESGNSEARSNPIIVIPAKKKAGAVVKADSASVESSLSLSLGVLSTTSTDGSVDTPQILALLEAERERADKKNQ